MRLLGPATLVATAYIDPGNFGANIESGMYFGLSLLWVVWASGLLAIAVQYMSGIIGIRTGMGILDHLARRPRLRPLAAPALLAMVAATDMAEYMGVVLGIHLLFGLPPPLAAAVGFLDVVFLAALAERRRIYTAAIGAMVLAVGLSFAVQLALIRPDWREVAASSLRPALTPQQALWAAAIIGATIMPHAVVLHSHVARGLTPREHALQTAANLALASAINASILISSAYILRGNHVEITEVPKILEPLYGPLAALLFSLALLLSGISSSAVSVEVGLLAAQYLVNRPMKAWKLRLAVRLLNLAPALAALHSGVSPLTVLVYSQAVLAATLPFFLTAAVHLSRGLVGRWLTAIGALATAFTTAVLLFTAASH